MEELPGTCLEIFDEKESISTGGEPVTNGLARWDINPGSAFAWQYQPDYYRARSSQQMFVKEAEAKFWIIVRR